MHHVRNAVCQQPMMAVADDPESIAVDATAPVPATGFNFFILQMESLSKCALPPYGRRQAFHFPQLRPQPFVSRTAVRIGSFHRATTAVHDARLKWRNHVGPIDDVVGIYTIRLTTYATQPGMEWDVAVFERVGEVRCINLFGGVASSGDADDGMMTCLERAMPFPAAGFRFDCV